MSPIDEPSLLPTVSLRIIGIFLNTKSLFLHFKPFRMEIKPGQLLGKINNPDDLKTLTREQLHQVCDELRQYIIDVVSVHGGHFAASLGVVELSVALHYVYNTIMHKMVMVNNHHLLESMGGRSSILITNSRNKWVNTIPVRMVTTKR